MKTKQPATRLELDHRQHRSLPYIEDGCVIHTVNDRGNRRRFPIAKSHGSIDNDCWEDRTVVEEVGVTSAGQWLLLRETDEGSEVKLFPGREGLCRFLWTEVATDPLALHTLLQLGALRFELGHEVAVPTR